MQLYYFETPNPRKPCSVARYLDSPVEYVRIDLAKGENKTPEFLAINPNGKVPALAVGEVKLWECPAIMMYLAQKAGSDLWPSEPEKQADVLRWLNWDTAHFSRHAQGLLFQRHIKPLFGLGDPDEAAIEEATGYFHQFGGVLNDHLKGRKYLLGDQLTIADFAVGSIMPTAKEAKLPMDDLPEITRWHEGMMALEGWANPFPST